MWIRLINESEPSFKAAVLLYTPSAIKQRTTLAEKNADELKEGSHQESKGF